MCAQYAASRSICVYIDTSEECAHQRTLLNWLKELLYSLFLNNIVH